MTAILRLLVSVFVLCLSGRASAVEGQTDRGTASAGHREPVMQSVELSLDRSDYFEGEKIPLTVHFIFDGTGGTGGDPLTMKNCLEITDLSGHEVRGEGMGMSDPPRARSSDLLTKGNLSGDFFSTETLAPSSFRHLLPGSYQCRYKCRGLSSSVSFRVLPIPDSIKDIWSHYSRISSVTDNSEALGLGMRAATDSVTHHLQQVMAYAPGHAFRKESLEKGLHIYWRTRNKGKMVNMPSVWASGDSLSCAQALVAYNQEPERSAAFVITTAWTTLYESLPAGTVKMQAVMNFAQSTGDSAVVQSAQSWLAFEARDGSK